MRTPIALSPCSNGKERAMVQGRRFKQQTTFQDRLEEWAKQVHAEADGLPPGPGRDALLKKIRQTETAKHLEQWVSSPGLQPPK
jgi:hypothetical protein